MIIPKQKKVYKEGNLKWKSCRNAAFPNSGNFEEIPSLTSKITGYKKER